MSDQGRRAEVGEAAQAAAMVTSADQVEMAKMVELARLDRVRSIHLLGIGGAGMSAIAEVLVAMGHRVSGSDRAESAVLRRLASLGVRVAVGHDPAHLGDAEIVAVSTAVAPDNTEVVAARSAGLPVVPRAALLGAISQHRPTLSITGTHGKTTTSALTVAAAGGAGFDPSFIIGGVVAPFGSGARWSDGPWFVLEADESDSSFLAPARSGAVVTNLEADHLDHHGSYGALERAVERFVAETAGPVVVCGDDPGVAALRLDHDRPLRYGVADGLDIRISDVQMDGDGSRWRIDWPDGRTGRAALRIPGMHLVLNATAAVGLVVACGGDPQAAIDGLVDYGGVGRRFEARGEVGGVSFVDDYAHLPTEIAATMSTARALRHQRRWSRIVAVVQPHRFSRTEETAKHYRDLFEADDVVVVTDVYGAGEDPRPGVDGRLVVDSIRGSERSPEVHWFAERRDLIEGVAAILRPGDLCLTLGAGDLTTLPDAVIAVLEER